MSNKKSRPGAVRKKSRGKAVGSGGQGRQALEGRGPTPKAEDRDYHPAGKAKAARDRLDAARKRHGVQEKGRGEQRAPRRKSDDAELVTGRNAVLEALRTRIPATALYVAARVEMDDRMREIIAEKQPFIRDEISEGDALVLFKDHKYKCEIIKGAAEDPMSATDTDLTRSMSRANARRTRSMRGWLMRARSSGSPVLMRAKSICIDRQSRRSLSVAPSSC